MSKATYSVREKKFLELYFGGALMKDAVRAAGYRGASDVALCNTGRAILTKYENSAPPKEIFRRVGASETRIAQLLLDMAENAKSESARVNALGILSKCLGLQREIDEGFQGFEIHLHGLERRLPPGAPGPGAPGPGAAGPQPGAPEQRPALPGPQLKAKQIIR